MCNANPPDTHRTKTTRPATSNQRVNNSPSADAPVVTERALDNISEDNIDASQIEFQLRHVPGDGDWFFYCLSLFLGGNICNAKNLRRLICLHIYNNWCNWNDLVEASHDIGTVSNKDDYWKRMAETKEYATQCEVRAACEIYDMSINVWLQGRRCTDTTRGKYMDTYYISRFNFKSNLKILHLLLKNNHYHVMEDKKTLRESGKREFEATETVLQEQCISVGKENENAKGRKYRKRISKANNESNHNTKNTTATADNQDLPSKTRVDDVIEAVIVDLHLKMNRCRTNLTPATPVMKGGLN